MSILYPISQIHAKNTQLKHTKLKITTFQKTTKNRPYTLDVRSSTDYVFMAK